MSIMTGKTPKAKHLLARFRGVFPAIPTPVTDEDEIDCPALRRLVNYLLDGGVHGIWALGSGGEFTSLTREERRLTLDTIVDEVDGRVPVLGGISSCCISEIEANAQLAAEAGVDGAFMIAPYLLPLFLQGHLPILRARRACVASAIGDLSQLTQQRHTV